MFHKNFNIEPKKLNIFSLSGNRFVLLFVYINPIYEKFRSTLADDGINKFIL